MPNLYILNNSSLMQACDWLAENSKQSGTSNVHKQTDEFQWSTVLGPRSYKDLATKIFVDMNECWPKPKH